jgi:signal transduction histidine kinase
MFGNDIQATILLTTLLILLLIAGVVITIFIANRRHTQQQISMTQMQLNYEKELRTVEQEVQEQVLVNVSRELHDNIGQLLTVMHLQLEQQKLKGGNDSVNEQLMSTLRDTTQQVRMLGKSLNNEWLEQSGLSGMIANEVNRLKQLNAVEIHFMDDGAEPQLEKDQKIMVFRIFQEIVNNMLKHAEAKNIFIELNGKVKFRLSVKDDGKGFDLDAIMASAKGSGLRNMMKRAALAHMDYKVETAAGKGSIFTIQPTNKG